MKSTKKIIAALLTFILIIPYVPVFNAGALNTAPVWKCSFEQGEAVWSYKDCDGDSKSFSVDNFLSAYHGSNYLVSDSNNCSPDNCAISPAVTLTNIANLPLYKLSWYVCSSEASRTEQYYSVYAYSGTQNINWSFDAADGFYLLAEKLKVESDSFVQKSVVIPEELNGKSVRFIIRHHETINQSKILFDNLTVEAFANADVELYSTSFEDTDAPWTVINANNDGVKWSFLSGTSYEGKKAAVSRSYYSSREFLPDDYMVSPFITVPADFVNIELRFFAGAAKSNAYKESFSVYVVKGEGELTADNIASSLPSPSINKTTLTEAAFNVYRVDLDSYAGQKIRIVIHHNTPQSVSTAEKSSLLIDSISVTGALKKSSFALFDANGGTFGGNESQFSKKFFEKEQITAPDDPAREGYDFVGWAKEKTASSALSSLGTATDKDQTFYAVWKVRSYSVSYYIDSVLFKTDSVEYGSVINTPAAQQKTGYDFSGWKNVPEEMPAENIRIDGNYTPIKEGVTFDANGGAWGTEKEITVESTYDSPITLPDSLPQKAGYTFKGWASSADAAEGSTSLGNYNGQAKFYAVWSANKATYKVNIYKMDTAGVYPKTPSETQSFDSYVDAAVTVKAETIEGFTFDKTASSSLTGKIPAEGELVFDLKYSRNKHTLEFVVDGKPVSSKEAYFGESISLIDEPEKIGYDFSGWDKQLTTMPDSDVVVSGSFSLKDVKVVFDGNGGTWGAESKDEKSLKFGAAITAPSDPARNGFLFLGWAKDANAEEGISDLGKVDSENEITFYAVWSAQSKTYKVNTYVMDVNGENKLESSVLRSGTVGETVVINNEPREGFTVDETTTAAVTADDAFEINIYYERNSYTLTYDYTVNGETDSKVYENVFFGSDISALAPTVENYTAKWHSAPSVMPAEDLTVTGEFTGDVVGVLFDSNGGEFENGILTCCINSNYGSDIIAPSKDPQREGYEFKGWASSADAQESLTSLGKCDSKVLKFYAVWEVKTYDYTVITYMMDLNGDYVNSRTETASEAYGTVVEAAAEDIEGFTFVDKISKTSGTVPARSGMVLSLYYSRNKYTISYIVDGEAVGEAADQFFGSVVTVKDEPTREGYTFSGWSIPDSLVKNDSDEYILKGNAEITGSFTANKYNIIFDANGGSFGDGSTTADLENCTYDSEYTVPGEPIRKGYSFEGWSLSPDSGETVTVGKVDNAADVTYYAVWETVISEYDVYIYEMDLEGSYSDDPTEIKNYNAVIDKDFTFTPDEKIGFLVDSDKSDLSGTENEENVLVFKVFYARQKYTLTYKYIIGEEEKTEEYDVYFGENIGENYPAPTCDGYTAEWGIIPETMPAENFEINGSFSANTYKITYEFDGKTVNELYLESGETVPAYEYKDEYFRIDSWKLKNSEPETDPEIDPEVTTEPETEPTTEAETEPATEAETEPATEAETEPATEVETESTTEVETESTTEAETEPTTEAETELTTKAETELTTEAETEPTTEAETELTTEAENESTTEAETETEISPDAVRDLYAGFRSEPESEPYIVGSSDLVFVPETVEIIYIDVNASAPKIGDEIKNSELSSEHGYSEKLTWYVKDSESEFYSLVYGLGSDDVTLNFEEGKSYKLEVTVTAKSDDNSLYKFADTEYLNAGKIGVDPSIIYGDNGEASAVTLSYIFDPVDYYKVEVYSDGAVLFTDYFASGDNIKLPADLTKTGHSFKGYALPDDPETVLESDSLGTMGEEDMVLFAVFAANAHKITYIVLNCDDYVDYVDNVDFGKAISVYAGYEKTGYTFSGWQPELPATMPDEDLTVYGSFAPNNYGITFNANGGSWSDGSTEQTVESTFDSEIALPSSDPVRTGYSFLGWAKDANAEEGISDLGKVDSEIEITFYAVWSADAATYTVNVYKMNTNGEYGDPESTVINSKTDEDISFVAESFEFFDLDENISSVIPEKVPAGEKLVIDLYYARNSHTLKYEIDGNAYDTLQVYYGAEFSLPEVAGKPGYSFNGWTVPEGVADESGKYVMPDTDVTIEGSFKANEYPVTFDANGGYWGDSVSLNVNSTFGEDIALPETEPQKAGYAFQGWSTDPNSGEGSVTLGKLESTEPETFYAVWSVKELRYTVKTYFMDLSGEYNESNVISDERKCEFGKTVSLSASDYEGFTFDSSLSTTSGKIPAAGTMVLSLYYSRNKHNIIYRVNNLDYEKVEGVYFGDTNIQIKDALTETGYSFSGWTVPNNLKDESGNYSMPNKDVYIYGTLDPLSYSVTFDANGGSFSGGNSTEVLEKCEFGSNYTVPASPTRDGYSFLGWAEDKDSTETVSVGKMNSAQNITYYAVWAANKVIYKVVTYMMGLDGEYSVFKTVQRSGYVGDKVTVTVDDIYGFTVKEGNSFEKEILADGFVIEIHYDRNVYKISYYVDGKADGETAEQFFGSVVTIKDEPSREGYTFSGWSIPETLAKNESDDYIISGDAEITGGFEANKYDVTFNSNGGKWSDNSTEKKVKSTYDSAIELPADPERDGYNFAGWASSSDAEEGIMDDLGNLTTVEPITYYAVWEAQKREYLIKTYTMDVNGKYGDPDVQPMQSFVDETEVVTPEEKAGFTVAKESVLSASIPANGQAVLEVYYSRNQLNLIYTVDGAEYKKFTVYYEAAVSAIADPSKEGYRFSGWTGVPEKMPNEDVTVTGAFTANDYPVVFNSNKGKWSDNTAEKEVYSTYDSAINLPADPEREGYNFAGWASSSDDKEGKKDLGILKTVNKITYYAVWKAVLCDICFDGNGGAINGNSQVIISSVFDSPINMPNNDPIREGYTFNGWSTDKSATEGSTSLGNLKTTVSFYYYAVWKINKHSITYSVPGFDNKVINNVEFGTTINVIADYEKTGYTFSGWQNPPATMPDSDVTIYGSFTANKYAVTFNSNGGKWSDNATEKKVESTFDSAIIIPAAPTRKGYTFVGWAASSTAETGEKSNLGILKSTEPLTYFAVWSINLTTAKIVKIRNNPGVKTIKYREGIKLTATVSGDLPEGSTLIWSVNGSNTEGDTFVKTDNRSDFTVTLKVKVGNTLYEQDTETVKVDAGFFTKLVAFFKSIFGGNPTVTQ